MLLTACKPGSLARMDSRTGCPGIPINISSHLKYRVYPKCGVYLKYRVIPDTLGYRIANDFQNWIGSGRAKKMSGSEQVSDTHSNPTLFLSIFFETQNF